MANLTAPPAILICSGLASAILIYWSKISRQFAPPMRMMVLSSIYLPLRGYDIKEETLYPGVRVSGTATLDSAKITFQVDIGFGDAVTPEAEFATLPSFLGLPEAKVKVYPVYTVIAEKFLAR